MAVVIDIPERLEGDRVVLRPLETGDADAYAQAFADDRELGRLVGFETDPTADQVAANLATAAERAAAGKFLELAVCSASDGRFMGTVLMHSLSAGNRRCEVGFWLVPSARRQRLGAAAVARFVDWIFDELPIDRIEMTTIPDNGATREFARHLGFTEEGVLRKRNFERGRRVDLVTFGLMVDEWRAGTADE